VSIVDARFIGGSGRCGTALLGSILADHPNVTYFREPRFLSDGNGLCDYVRGKTSLAFFRAYMVKRFRRNLVNKLRTVETVDVGEIYRPEAITAIMDATLEDRGDRVADGRAFVLTLFGRMGRPYWVEKTPHTVMHADVLYQMFPNMRYVHMIRDPRDVFASLMHQHWGPKSGPAFVRWYNGIMDQARKAYERVHWRNYLVVSLEELIRAPFLTVSEVFEFMEIPHGTDWLWHTVRSRVSKEQSHVGRYNELSKQDLELIERECLTLYEYWKGQEHA
jgi:hypothetical protein